MEITEITEITKMAGEMLDLPEQELNLIAREDLDEITRKTKTLTTQQQNVLGWIQKQDVSYYSKNNRNAKFIKLCTSQGMLDFLTSERKQEDTLKLVQYISKENNG